MMNGDQFISLLGLTSHDEKVKGLLAEYGFTKPPRLNRGDIDVPLGNKKLGIDVNFTDERHLDVKSREHKEGSLVLTNVRMYCDGHPTYKAFQGSLPLGLKCEMKSADAEAQLGKKADWENPSRVRRRWDLKGHSLFIRFDETQDRILEVSVQLPLK